MAARSDKEPSKSTKQRPWCFVFNNYAEHLADNSELWLNVSSVRPNWQDYHPRNRREFSLDLFTDLAMQNGAKYVVIGLEEAPTTGTPHLQGFVYFKNETTFHWLKKTNPFWSAMPEISWRACDGSIEQNYVYATKDKRFIEKGIKPLDKVAKGKKSDEMYRHCIELAEAAKFEELKQYAPGFYVSHFNTWQRIASDANHTPSDLEDCCGIWLYGRSGCGKSHLVRSLGFPIYDKLFNKWWCGYRGQTLAILDDADPDNCKYISGFIKRWLDKYWFNAEVKQSNRNLRPKFLIITSQYSIEECFPDSRTCEAITRRCCSYEVTKENRVMLAATLKSYINAKIAPSVSVDSEPSSASPVRHDAGLGSRSSVSREVLGSFSRSRSPSPSRGTDSSQFSWCHYGFPGVYADGTIPGSYRDESLRSRSASPLPSPIAKNICDLLSDDE